MENEVIEKNESLALERARSALVSRNYDEALFFGLVCYGDAPADERCALALLAARMRSRDLTEVLRGNSVGKTEDDLLELIKNEHLLLQILSSVTDNLAKGKLCEYTVLVIERFLSKPKEQLSGFMRENPVALKEFICRTLPLVLKNVGRRGYFFEKYADLLLTHEAYDEARALYEHSLKYEGEPIACRLGILLAALNIQSEAELETAKLFDPQMQEYNDLLLACQKNKRKRRYYEELGAKNQQKHADSHDGKGFQLHLGRISSDTLRKIGVWCARLVSLLFVAFMLAYNGGALFFELLESVPFLGAREGGLFCDFFNLFILIAFVLNVGNALGMTTNLGSLMRLLTQLIFHYRDASYDLPYSPRKRTMLMSMNLLLCFGVKLFGEQFALHTPLPAGWEAVFGIVMGALATAFIFYIFQLLVVVCEDAQVGKEEEDALGFGLMIGGLGFLLGSITLYVKAPIALPMLFEDYVLVIFAVLGVLLLLSGAVYRLVAHIRSEYGHNLNDEPALLYLSLASAIAIFTYRVFFFGEISWHWAFIIVLGFFALANLIPMLIRREWEKFDILQPLLWGMLIVSILIALQYTVLRYDFTPLLMDYQKLLPTVDSYEQSEVVRSAMTICSVFYSVNLVVLLLPAFVSYAFIRVVCFPLRILRIKPSFLEMNYDFYARAIPRKLFVCTVLSVAFFGARHLLVFLSGFLLSEIGPTVAKGVMIAVSVILSYLAMMLVYYLMKWTRETFANTLFEWDDRERLWTIGYHIHNISAITLTLGILRLLEMKDMTGVSRAESLISYFMIGASALLVVLSILMRIAGKKGYSGGAEEEINATELGLGFTYLGLALVFGVLAYLIGAESLILPLGAVAVSACLGVFAGFANFKAAEDWWL